MNEASPKIIRRMGYLCEVTFGIYANNNRLAIRLIDIEDGSPIGNVTVNLPEEQLPEGYAFIHAYGENEDALQEFIDAGLIEAPIEYRPSGYVMVPMCKLLVEPPPGMYEAFKHINPFNKPTEETASEDSHSQTEAE